MHWWLPRSTVGSRLGEVLSVADATGDFGHVPVLLDRCVALLTPAVTRHHPDGSGAVLVDATIGAGGHAERFLTELPGLRLIGIDRDPTALDIARTRLARFADRLTLIQTRYDGIGAALAESGYAAPQSVDGILFDLASRPCSSTAASAVSPIPRTRRWTCGWIPRRR